MPFIIVRNEDPKYPLYLVDLGQDVGWSARKRDATPLWHDQAETIATELSRHASIVAVDIVGVRNTVESLS